MDGNAPELIHCVVRATPPHEGASLHRLLAQHGCRLVVDGREAERRRALERRARSAQADERRRIRGNDGRRVTDRRAGAEPVTPPPELLVRAPALASADFARVRRLTPRERTDAEMTRAALRFQAGDQSAFEAIYHAYRHDLGRYLSKVLGESDADDVMHEVFIRALKALPGYEPQGASFGRWLLTIARNAALDVMRKTRPIALDAHAICTLRDEELRGHRHGLAGDYDVGQLVDALPPDQREILLLRYELGFKPHEIAALLGRSPAGVSGARHRALRALEAALTEAKHPAAVGGPRRRSGKFRPLPAAA